MWTRYHPTINVKVVLLNRCADYCVCQTCTSTQTVLKIVAMLPSPSSIHPFSTPASPCRPWMCKIRHSLTRGAKYKKKKKPKRRWLLSLQIEDKETVRFKVTSCQILHFFPVICPVILAHLSLIIPYGTPGFSELSPLHPILGSMLHLPRDCFICSKSCATFQRQLVYDFLGFSLAWWRLSWGNLWSGTATAPSQLPGFPTELMVGDSVRAKGLGMPFVENMLGQILKEWSTMVNGSIYFLHL